MVLKLDFVNLDAFLHLNPQYSQELRQEVLKLDTRQDKLIDRNLGDLTNAFEAQHTLDQTEIRDFFQHEGISYETLFYEFDPALAWKVDLASYIFAHCPATVWADDVLLTGFPIPEGATLTEDPQENMRLVLQYYKDKMRDLSDLGDDTEINFQGILASSPFGLEEAETGLVGEDHTRVIGYMPEARPNAVFWQIIDPQQSSPELAIKFTQCLYDSSLVYRNAYFENIWNRVLQREETNQKILKNSELSVWWESFIAAWEGEFPPRTANLSSYLELEAIILQKHGLVLKEGQRPEFERILDSDAFRQSIDSDSLWSGDITRRFFRFFPGFKPEGGLPLQIRPSTPLIEEGEFSINIDDVMQSLGYEYQYANDEGQLIFFREIKRVKIVSASALPASDMALDWQPMATRDQELFNKYSFQWPVGGESGLVYVSEWCRGDFFAYLKKNYPGLWPLLKDCQVNANEVLSRFAQDLMTGSLYFNDEGFNGFIDKSNPSSRLAAYHYALSRSEDCKVALSLLFFFALRDDGYSAELRGLLPDLLSSVLNYEETGRRGKKFTSMDGVSGEESIVESERHAAANAWVVWDKNQVLQAAERLAAFDEKTIRERILQNQPAWYEQAIGFSGEYFHIQEREVREPGQFPSQLEFRSAETDFIPLQKLLRHTRLEGTRERLKKLDETGRGVVSLSEVLQQSWSGPEREDVRKTLGQVLHGKILHAILTVDVSATRWSGHVPVPQLELLPPRVLEYLITEGHITDRLKLWEALFRANEVRALRLWRDCLQEVGRKLTEGSALPRVEFGKGYPNDMDVRWGENFAFTSTHPLAREVMLKFAWVLRDKDIRAADELYQIKMGEKGILDFEITSLKGKSEISEFWSDGPEEWKKQWGFANDLIRLLEGYLRIYPAPPVEKLQAAFTINGLDEKYFDYVLGMVGLKPLETAQAKAIFADLCASLEGKFNLESFARLQTAGEMPLAEKDKEILPPLFASLWFFVERQHLWGEQGLSERFFALAKSGLQINLLSGGDFADGVSVSLENGSLTGADLPAWVNCVGLFYGKEWALENIKEQDLFVEQPYMDGHDYSVEPYQRLFFPPTESWQMAYDNARNTFLESVYTGQFNVGMAKVFFNLRQKFGDFVISARPDLSSQYYLSDFLFEKPQNTVTKSVFIQLKEAGYESETAFEMLKNIRNALERGDIQIDDTLDPKDIDWQEKIQRFLYPEREFPELLHTLSRFDDVDYPHGAFTADKTGFSLDEVGQFEWKIVRYYRYFIARLAQVVQLKNQGYPVVIADQGLLGQIPEGKELSPWLLYTRDLVGALAGDELSKGRLWQYYEGELTLTSDIAVFDYICQALLAVGRQVLLYLDPARFFYGKGLGRLPDETILAQVEPGRPDATWRSLQGHLDNPVPPDQHTPQGAVIHASKVAQILVGNPGPHQQASGRVRSYTFQLKPQETIWQGFSKALQEVADDVQAGKDIAVVNMSFGFEAPAIGEEFQRLLASEDVARVRRLIGYLRRHKIPIVISAPNKGGGRSEGSFEEMTLKLFDILSTVDPSLILVGATRLSEMEDKPEKPLEEGRGTRDREDESLYDLGLHLSAISHEVMANHSSPGNIYYHADVSALGSGFTLWEADALAEEDKGASLSAPVVSRVIAIMKEKNPHLSVEMIQTIVKFSAQDLSHSSPEKEGAGALRPKYCVYLASAVRPFVKRDRLQTLGADLGLTFQEQKNLDFLARRLRLKVWFGDASHQVSGE